MKGTIDNAGNVVITFNMQAELLEAPGGKKYLPCEICGKIQAVDYNVVTMTCGDCMENIKNYGICEPNHDDAVGCLKCGESISDAEYDDNHGYCNNCVEDMI